MFDPVIQNVVRSVCYVDPVEFSCKATDTESQPAEMTLKVAVLSEIY